MHINVCGKSLIGSALVRFGARQHARAETIPSVLDRPLRHLSVLESMICERSGSDYRKTPLQILLSCDAICIQRFTGTPRTIVVRIVSDLLMCRDHLRAFLVSTRHATSFPGHCNRAASPGHDRRSSRSTARTCSMSCRSRHRSPKVGGTSNRGKSHARDIALRRRTKQAAVLAAELRSAFIPNTACGATRVEVLIQHQLPCFL